MSRATPLHRTLEQELFAVLRGASLECPVCGEFVLHEGALVRCPECSMRLHGRIDGAGAGSAWAGSAGAGSAGTGVQSELQAG